MQKKKDQNFCIRVNRDVEQIKRGKQKMEVLDDDVFYYANIFQLAGNPVRLKILILLSTEKKLCVCDISEILEMKIPAVSQHLRKLKDGDMVEAERQGSTIFYKNTAKSLIVMKTFFTKITP